jgi:hypothetical protein
MNISGPSRRPTPSIGLLRTAPPIVRTLLLHLAVALQALFVPVLSQDKPGATASHLPQPPVVGGDSLVEFVSDTQSPIFIETLRIPSNRNDVAREMIMAQMLRDNPNAVFHLGDMIAIGLYAATWHSIDEFLTRARTAHIPVFPTLGNHELMLFPSYGIEQFFDRFPWYRKTGYTVRAGKLAVVLLNSNFSQLSDREKTFQLSWLDSTLSVLESDTTVAAVIMGCHHSPYTNSTIVSPSKEVEESFVPLYLRYAKCRLFVSGHCHAVEHFRQGGKDFLVIGGGGGLQQPLLTGSEQRWGDLFPEKTEKRMFHYLRCRITGHGLDVTVRMVKPDFSGFEDAYALSLPFSPSSP